MEPKEGEGRAKAERFTVSLPASQTDALERMVQETGLSKNDLVRQAVAILSASKEAQKKGLDLAFVKDDEVYTHVILA